MSPHIYIFYKKQQQQEYDRSVLLCILCSVKNYHTYMQTKDRFFVDRLYIPSNENAVHVMILP